MNNLNTKRYKVKHIVKRYIMRYFKHNKYEKVACYGGCNLVIHNTDENHKGKMWGFIDSYDVGKDNYKELKEWCEISVSEYIQLTGFDESVMRNYL